MRAAGCRGGSGALLLRPGRQTVTEAGFEVQQGLAEIRCDLEESSGRFPTSRQHPSGLVSGRRESGCLSRSVGIRPGDRAESSFLSETD